MSSSSLLPALELIPFNPSLAEDVWGILRDFPYTLRFQVYATVAAGFQEHPILSMTANQSLETAREVVSQCSAPISADRSRSSKGEREDKEKVKKFARTLAKASGYWPPRPARGCYSLR